MRAWKGIIPKWIINFVAPRKPGEWIDCLKKAPDHAKCRCSIEVECHKIMYNYNQHAYTYIIHIYKLCNICNICNICDIYVIYMLDRTVKSLDLVRGSSLRRSRWLLLAFGSIVYMPCLREACLEYQATHIDHSSLEKDRIPNADETSDRTWSLLESTSLLTSRPAPLRPQGYSRKA